MVSDKVQGMFFFVKKPQNDTAALSEPGFNIDGHYKQLRHSLCL